jgi:hypothetical protein
VSALGLSDVAQHLHLFVTADGITPLAENRDDYPTMVTSVCPLIGCDTMPEPVRHIRNHVLGARPDTLINMLDRQPSAAPHYELAASPDDIQSLVREHVAAALEDGSQRNITVLVARDSRRGNHGH